MPIILTTGFSELINEEKAKEIGIKALLMKPISIQDLSQTLRRVLDEPDSVK
jgi:CheY-like chemotaxis protein